MQSAAAIPQTQERAGDIQSISAADPNEVKYLGALRRLAAEVSLARDAIAGNRPAQLLASTQRQESLLAELIALRRTVLLAKGNTILAINPSTTEEIERAEQVLWNLIRSHSVLLHRSAQTVVLLARLHSSYAAEYPRAGQPIRAKATWSCEG